MANATVDVIAPRWLIVPNADIVSGCAYTGYADATTGAMLMSGALLYYFNGTAWVTTSGATAFIA